LTPAPIPQKIQPLTTSFGGFTKLSEMTGPILYTSVEGFNLGLCPTT